MYKPWQVGLAVVAAVVLGIGLFLLPDYLPDSKRPTAPTFGSSDGGGPRDSVQREVRLEPLVRDASWDGDVLTATVNDDGSGRWDAYAAELCRVVRKRVSGTVSVKVLDATTRSFLGRMDCS